MRKILFLATVLVCSICTVAQNNNAVPFVHTIDINGIPHRDYSGRIVYSSLSQIHMLLNEDVAGYYKISGISTEVQKKVFVQSEEYKNIYLPRLKKEKEYLLQDEFEQYFTIDEDCVKHLEYDMSGRRFHFELTGHETDRYKLSSEKNTFHVLVSIYGHDFNFCLSYPKSLVSVVNGRSYRGPMAQEQTLYTCVIPETEAVRFYPERRNSLLWRFKIEKVKDGRLYGKSTSLRVVEGEPNGTNTWGEPLYRYIIRKDQPQKIVLDLSNTFSQKGNTFRSVKNAK